MEKINRDQIESKRRLAIFRKELARIVEYMKDNEVLSVEERQQLVRRFKAQNVFESKSGSASYIVRKETLYISLGADASMKHEAIHMLAHMVDKSIGHTTSFWSIKERMMKVADEMPKPMSLCAARRIVAYLQIQSRWKTWILVQNISSAKTDARVERDEGVERKKKNLMTYCHFKTLKFITKTKTLKYLF